MRVKKYHAMLVLLAFAVVIAMGSTAGAATLKIINKSASEIHGIYISDSRTNDWEENIIEGYYLPSGDQLDVQVTGSYRSFDLRVEDEEGNYEEYTGFPGKTRAIEIHGGGDSKYR